MPRQICLAEPADGESVEGTRRFSILGRAPLRLSEHDAVWDALRNCSERRLVVDVAHPEEGFPAGVVAVASLTNDRRADLEDAVADARIAALEAERISGASGPFSKGLDALFDRQQEWLTLRSVLVQSLGRTRTSIPVRTRKRRRVLLLTDD